MASGGVDYGIDPIFHSGEIYLLRFVPLVRISREPRFTTRAGTEGKALYQAISHAGELRSI
jgi:hypothetical protein